jgi:hypothetical protein
MYDQLKYNVVITPVVSVHFVYHIDQIHRATLFQDIFNLLNSYSVQCKPHIYVNQLFRFSTGGNRHNFDVRTNGCFTFMLLAQRTRAQPAQSHCFRHFFLTWCTVSFFINPIHARTYIS